MADNGFDSIKKAAGGNLNLAGKVANSLRGGTPPPKSDVNPAKGGAIARRLAKGPSKSSGPGDNGTNQESGY